ncbi:MAG: hypothetical protein JST30_15720 [Armatimonadetes bacterium]|nr:hypothetical protein [Armatimonadota bacterium]
MRNVCLVVLALATAVAQAEPVLAVGYDGKTTTIDSDTGVGSTFGPGGLGSLNALAYHQGTFYAAGQDDRLLSIDPVTGVGTLATNLGTNDVRGLASANGVLYGIKNGIGADDSDILLTIDPRSGTVVQIGKLGTPYNAVQALASWNGVLYAWDINLGLVTVDASTGLAADVGTWPGTDEIQGMDFLSDGTLIGGRDRLLKVDLVTGGFSVIGGGGYSDVRGLAVVPEPALALGLLLTLGALRRRSR